MRFIITGRNIDVTPGLKTAVEDKLGKLEKFFKPDTEVNVTLSVEKDRQKIEVTIPVKGSIIRSEQVSNDMYVSIDLVEEVIERQMKKYKNKIVEIEQSTASETAGSGNTYEVLKLDGYTTRCRTAYLIHVNGTITISGNTLQVAILQFDSNMLYLGPSSFISWTSLPYTPTLNNNCKYIFLHTLTSYFIFNSILFIANYSSFEV